MEKITNLTMNLYILLNSNTTDGFRGPYIVYGFREGSLNPSAVLEFSKLIMYYHNITPLIKHQQFIVIIPSQNTRQHAIGFSGLEKEY